MRSSIQDITGTSGDNTLNGTTGDDTIDISQGGNDTVRAKGGHDTIFAGATFNAADHIDGGDGDDALFLDGNYKAGVIISDSVLHSVEQVRLATGHSYTFTFNATFQPSAEVMFNLDGYDLAAGNVLKVNGSAVMHGAMRLYGGAGNDVLTGTNDPTVDGDQFYLDKGGNDTVKGGDGYDIIQVGGALTAADKIDGGAGYDVLELDGNYATQLVLGAATVKNVEYVDLAADHSYNIKTNDATVAKGKVLTIYGQDLKAGDKLTFDGSAEKDGSFDIHSGRGADVLTGGLKGDTFTFEAAIDSTGTHYDTLNAVSYASDKFDVQGTISAIDKAVTSGKLDLASFDANLKSALDGHLKAHHAILFTASTGTLHDETFLVVDINGKAGYQSGADLVLHMENATGTLVKGDFI
jgi:Ca2+-binding RTX toxin-like protein